MFENITIGQYIPGNSFIHNMNVLIKIIMLLMFYIMIFTVNSIYGIFTIGSLSIIVILLTKIPIGYFFRIFKSLVYILVFTVCIKLIFTSGKIIFELGFIQITYEGVYSAVVIFSRIVFLVLITIVLTFTSTPLEISSGIEKFLFPLKIIKVDIHTIGMIIAIALRFIPTILYEADNLVKAQKCRGVELNSKGIYKKIKMLIPIVLPLIISSVKRAENLTVAMDSRGYLGGNTRRKILDKKIKNIDIVLLIINLVIYTAVIYFEFIKL